MILLLLHMVYAGIQRLFAWFASQSIPHLIIWFHILLLLLYVSLAIVSAFFFPSVFGYEIAIRIPGVSVEKLWDHIADVQKNPLSGKHRIRTTRVISNSSSNNNLKGWEEEIGSNEILKCRRLEEEDQTLSTDKDKRRLVRECNAGAVNLTARITYLLANSTNPTPTNYQQDNNNLPPSPQTMLRLFVEVEAKWGSFWTPMLRLLLTQKNQEIMEQITTDYLERLCQDMGVDNNYIKAEAWE